jgi:hypothetical protein
MAPNASILGHLLCILPLCAALSGAADRHASMFDPSLSNESSAGCIALCCSYVYPVRYPAGELDRSAKLNDEVSSLQPESSSLHRPRQPEACVPPASAEAASFFLHAISTFLGTCSLHRLATPRRSPALLAPPSNRMGLLCIRTNFSPQRTSSPPSRSRPSP